MTAAAAAWGRAGLALAVALPLAAAAAPANYQCTGYKPLKVEFTPRKAQVHFEEASWELLRVRDARGAMYVSKRAGVSLTIHKGDMSLTRGGETLSCKLLTNALAPENLGVPAATAPSASASR